MAEVDALEGIEAIQLIVKSGRRSTPCGCPLLSPRGRSVGTMADQDRRRRNGTIPPPAGCGLIAARLHPKDARSLGIGRATKCR